MNKNQLGAETSPYLLQHQHNPVHWHPWKPAAFLKAQEHNKPILLSVGYSACHWCHVMAHESFEDVAIAKIMNANFINIKVDREERPDLDRYYQQALTMLGKQGGWPLTMFLTPKGQPFWGGTYFPPSERFGLPSFPRILSKISMLYKTNPHAVFQIGSKIEASARALSLHGDSSSVPVLNDKILKNTAHNILLQLDLIQGGFTGAPKFPNPLVFQLLWRAYERTHNMQFKDAVFLLLLRISKGGIYDHLGGGYCRYSTDDCWLVPHFEKMLYDNAQLLELLRLVWLETKHSIFKQRIVEIITWLKEEMTLPQGGFAAAMDADSEGEEGKFYTWTEAEIDEALGENSSYFKNIYGVTTEGNWEGKNILNLSAQKDTFKDDPQLLECRSILLKKRANRAKPSRDDKVLADWNGLMISALANASATFDKPEWLKMAEEAFSFVVDNLGQGCELRHSWCAGHKNEISLLEDYGAMAKAALDLFQVTGNPKYLEYAEEWVKIVHRDYVGEEGGYYQNTRSETLLIPRLQESTDGVIPSGNSLMLEVLVRLSLLTEKPFYKDQVENTFHYFSLDIQSYSLSHTAMIRAYDLWKRPLKVTITGKNNDPLKQDLLEEIYKKSFSNLVIFHKDSNENPTAMICKDFTCSLPFSSPDLLVSHLEGLWLQRPQDL